MTRPTASPKIAAAARRAGANALTECRATGTPLQAKGWAIYDAATIAKYLRPGDLQIAQRAYLMCVDSMAADLELCGAVSERSLRLERALAEFIEGHGYSYFEGKFVDDHARFEAARQQREALPAVQT